MIGTKQRTKGKTYVSRGQVADSAKMAIFSPSQIYVCIRGALRRAVRDIAGKPRLIIIILAAGLMLWLVFSLSHGVYWILVSTFALYRWDFRTPAAAAITAIMATALLFVTGADDAAEIMSLAVFYLLLATLILAAIELVASQGLSDPEPENRIVRQKAGNKRVAS